MNVPDNRKIFARRETQDANLTTFGTLLMRGTDECPRQQKDICPSGDLGR